jgi:hypothetical protein
MATVKKPDARVPSERANFNFHLLTNPNYFGNLKDTPFKKVVKDAIVGNKTYEELTCLGFNPQKDLLEAVITVKLNSGYGTSICFNGTNEYVRFYADYGAGWQDLGFSSVRVHDIPGPKPICYHAKINIDPPRKFCGLNDSLVKVRAILSWQTVPPPDTPDYPPVWGNVVDSTIQIRPTYKKLWVEIFDELKLKKIDIPKALSEAIAFVDPDTELAVTPKKLTLDDKVALYQNTKVGADRFAHDEIEKLASINSVSFKASATQTPLAKVIATKQIDALIKAVLSAGDGNTNYEELRCVGYRSEDNTVTAVLTVKQGGGYSGTLCTNGSTEYVAFYFSPNNDGNFFHLGTAGVQVHDLVTVPAGGVQYSITMPVDVGKWLKDCKTPVVGMLRGILRWGAPPPPNDPDYTPFWGNREECLMQLQPGDPADALIPSLLNISDVPADAASINPAGLAIAGERPFGGIVAIRGRMAGFLDREYKIEVRNLDSGEVRVLGNAINVFFAEEDAIGNPVDCIPGGVFNFECVKHVVPVGGWYPYTNRATGSGRTYLTDNTLGFWHTGPNDEGRWEIKATFRQTGNPLTEVDTQTVVVRIDNTAPTVFAAFTGLVQCGKFKKGQIINGTWSSHDPGSSTLVPNPAAAVFQHWGAISAVIIPSLGCGPVNFDGSGSNVRTYADLLDTTGGSGSWTVDTSGCDPCGYAIRFIASDRTIYGYSGGPTFYVTSLTNEYDLGYCLDLP